MTRSQTVIDNSELDHIGVAQAAFTLENGGAMIEKYFSQVEIIRDSSICEATDPQVIFDYTMSMDAKLDESKVKRLINDEIAASGFFAVTRNSGMFVAQK